MKIKIPAHEPPIKDCEHLNHNEIEIDLGEDVVRVVFCKDCKHFTPFDNGYSWVNRNRLDGTCDALIKIHDSERYVVLPDHYCSYGKRKNER